MYKLFLLLTMLSILSAETNTTKDNNRSSFATDINNTKRIEQQVKEQMAREQEYAQSQSFAQGDDYDLKAVEVNVESLDSIPSIEPDYDFDMTDVYRDDL